MKLYDLLYKKSEDKNGKARWERVGTLIDKGDKQSVKLDMMPISKKWDGWLVVSERKEKLSIAPSLRHYACPESIRDHAPCYCLNNLCLCKNI